MRPNGASQNVERDYSRGDCRGGGSPTRRGDAFMFPSPKRYTDRESVAGPCQNTLGVLHEGDLQACSVGVIPQVTFSRNFNTNHTTWCLCVSTMAGGWPGSSPAQETMAAGQSAVCVVLLRCCLKSKIHLPKFTEMMELYCSLPNGASIIHLYCKYCNYIR